MAYKQLNLKPFARGDDWTIKYTMTDESGTPIDITGNTYWVTLKANRTDSDPGAAQVSVVASGTNATNGIVIVAISSTVTATITPGTYFYDLQEVDTLGNVYTLLLGRVKVERDITISTS